MCVAEQQKLMRMCGNKVRYGNREAAIGAALRCSRDFGPMSVYHCPHCGKFHITKQAK